MNKNQLDYIKFKAMKTTEIDGPGHRIEILFAGCTHDCPGCHAKQLQDKSEGIDLNTEIKNSITDFIVDEYTKHPFTSGITLSGGDPLIKYSRSSLLNVFYAIQKAEEILKIKINIWCYTGFTFEELLKDIDEAVALSHKLSDDEESQIKYHNGAATLRLLSMIDILVDGRFELKNRFPDDKNIFRGSSNQRIIKCKESLKQRKIIELAEEEYYD